MIAPEGLMPRRATLSSAGYDFYAPEDIRLELARAVIILQPERPDHIMLHPRLFRRRGSCRPDRQIAIQLARVGRNDGRTQLLGEAKA